MGQQVCGKCGNAAEVVDARKPWKCPACGTVNGEARWQRVGSGVAGVLIVAAVAFGVLVVFLFVRALW